MNLLPRIIVGLSSLTALLVTVPTRADTVYVTELFGSTVYKVDALGSKTAFASDLNRPRGIAVDSSDNVFVGDTSLQLIYKYAPDGTRTIFAQGVSGDAESMAFDAFGDLFVGTEANGLIYKFDPAGNRTTFTAGLSSAVYALAFAPNGDLFAGLENGVYHFDGSGAGTLFTNIGSATELAFDKAGYLFVCRSKARKL